MLLVTVYLVRMIAFLKRTHSHNIYVMVDVCLLLLLLYPFDKVVVVRNQRTLPVNVGC